MQAYPPQERDENIHLTKLQADVEAVLNANAVESIKLRLYRSIIGDICKSAMRGEIKNYEALGLISQMVD